MNDNPKFYKTVELDGEVIATIKAKTHNDGVEIEDRAWTKRVVKNEYKVDVNFEKSNIIRIRQALTGDDKVGWDSEKPVTEESISFLPPDVFGAILSAINELDKSWQDGNVSKN
jgi:hypothetical protein